jgi:hypothetical protein
MTPARLGRIVSATVLAPSLESACESYARALHLAVLHWTVLTPTMAAHLDLHELSGARSVWLGTAGQAPWLRVIEAASALPAIPMRRHGWLALEVLVGNVDVLVAALPPGWIVLGPPADLDVSPNIRASQVLGPCGEMYYLTEVKAPVPPFDLPQTTALVDRPFIVVLSTPSRDRTQAAWEALAERLALAFHTRITVLNRELGRALGERYPVAVLQFREQCLIEIDEVALPPFDATQRVLGTHLVSIACDSLDRGIEGLGAVHAVDGPGYGGARSALWRGPCGERVELIESVSR